MAREMTSFLSISEKILVLPVIHGSGDFAVEVRDRLLRMEPDCIALPLPESFREKVEEGVLDLPAVSIVAAEERIFTGELNASWDRAFEDEEYDLPSEEDVPTAIVAA